MKAVLYVFAALFRLVGLVLTGGGARVVRDDCGDKLGYPDVMKLRSTHVDPYRTGNYFRWTKKDE